MSELSAAAARVAAALRGFGVTTEVVELPASTRSAAEAAQAIGCTVREIAKSIVFQGGHSGLPYLVIASGDCRIDEQRLAALVAEPIARAKPEFVREQLGFAIGGVPPLGHLRAVRSFVDESVLTLASVWAAAGTPHAVFNITPQELLRVTAGELVAVASC